jgi:hypothetical protein
MTAKLRIKAKGIEIEWEGEVDYLKNDLPDLIAAIGSVPAWLSSRADMAAAEATKQNR